MLTKIKEDDIIDLTISSKSVDARKKENIVIDPIIHGGKSTTVFRSGTPALPLIVSLSKALRLIYENIDENYQKVKKLNLILREKLQTIPNIYINSNEVCSLILFH